MRALPWLLLLGIGSASLPARAGQVEVELYVMSKCPFAIQVEKTMAEVLARFGSELRFQMDFIGRVKPDGTLTSMHGESEVRGDLIQICAQSHAPDRFLELVNCMNEQFRQIPDGWQDCARRLGLQVGAIAECADSAEGTALLQESFRRSEARGARGSPTIYFGGRPHRGGRSETDFSRAICETFGHPRPAVCASIPEPARFDIVVLSDRRCKDCHPQLLAKRMEGLFPGARVRTVDYSESEGRRLYREMGLEKLPAVILGAGANQASQFSRVERFLTRKGDAYVMRMGGRFDPSREICDNGIDDTGNGLVDCADPDCRDTFDCREAMPGKLEVFIMSHCPYAARGLLALEESLDPRRGGPGLELHYVATRNPDGSFRALHGQKEVDENIRQLCAAHHYAAGHRYLDYVLCRMRDPRSEDWQACTGSNGIETAVIARCAQGPEGERLLAEDIQVAERLGIGASPTWVACGKHKFSGIQADQLLSGYCRHDPDLPLCRPPAERPAERPPETPLLAERGPRILRVAQGGRYMPLHGEQAGLPSGLEAELAGELARELGMQVAFVDTRREYGLGSVTAVARGKVDCGLNAISPTPERRVEVDFTRPYLTLRYRLAGRPGAKPGSLSTSRARVAVARGLAQRAVEQLMPRATLIVAPDMGTAVAEVLAGRADYAAGEDVGLLLAIEGKKLTVAGEPFGESPIAIAVPKGRAAEFDAALSRLAPRIEALVRKWQPGEP
ncbi:MAG: transporter substrate-binding domain-containing protein [Deltaproteobacteria bacterium]|nr:transporter substrate-binding domain-containing protein [Deltaproteobacteria bacterium]